MLLIRNVSPPVWHRIPGTARTIVESEIGTCGKSLFAHAEPKALT
jgi:hypothetical protein